MLDSAEDVLGALTPAQREAASIVDGAALVLAGPGSGKTRVITRRIAYLVGVGVPAWNILALTFTNKAASEMRARVDSLVPHNVPGRRGLTVATFHSFCAQILRRFPDAAGLREGFSIYDTGDQRDAMKEAIVEAGLSSTNFSPAAVLSIVSDAKNKLIDAETFARQATDFTSRSVAKAYAAYQALLVKNNAVDFDDLLVKVATLLRNDHVVLRSLQERYRYILIDEYQDTNHAQFVIAHALAAEHKNLFVVGDPDQSIYGWRGADLSNILDFEEHFPRAVVIPLGQNFRSTGHIVTAASSLIQHNRRRKHKDLSTELGDGEKLVVARVSDEHEEASRIADFFEDASRRDVDWRRMAVLYRMNALSRVIEDELRRRNIPYVVARGTAYWDRKEVKDVLAYLRLVANPSDDTALRRIINVPARGIGDTSVRRLQALAANAGMPLGDYLAAGYDVTEAVGRSARSVRAFGQMLSSWRERASALPPGDLPTFVADVLRESGLDNDTGGLAGEDELEARRNREEIVNAAADRRDAILDAPDGDAPRNVLDALRDFLAAVALVSDQDLVDAARGAVTLLTMHAAKGLEFEAVAIAGVEQGILPHQRAFEDEGGLEEERRLFFVGMTRAERRLLLTVANARTTRGIRASTIESQFIGEIPPQHIAFEDARRSADFSSIEYDDDAFVPDEDGRAVPTAKRFPIGSVVRHPLFGVGRVEQVVDRGANSSARVAFRTVGIKTLVLRFARLERIE
ncbi:MAG: UvrD-helicase domain-containing protein [Phycisphaerae bacterium]|nr:UvrD-helicase domain-containing protein [Phycisphaerae bacterium]